MAGSTTKKVLVRRFDRDTLSGFINPLSYLQPETIELLRPDGSLLGVPYHEIRSVCFVKDFDSDIASGQIFRTRPKLEGIWVRMLFRDGEIMDGILPNNLLVWEAAGFTVTPPEQDSNTQRIFVPRQALRSIQVLGVVGSPLRAKRRKTDSAEQPTLF